MNPFQICSIVVFCLMNETANAKIAYPVPVISPETGLQQHIPALMPGAGNKRKIEETLRRDCGTECVEILNHAMDMSNMSFNQSKADTIEFWQAVLQSLSKLAEHNLAHGLQVHETFTNTSIQEIDADKFVLHEDVLHHAPLDGGSFLAAGGTACRTNSECKIHELIANKCSHTREVTQLVYQAVNLVAHVMTVVITNLCGCLFVGNQAVCVLSSIPVFCSIPYNLYNAVFRMSVQLWEAVKSTTKVCIVHGDISISS